MTTPAELRSFDILCGVLGAEHPVSGQDVQGFFKIYVTGKKSKTVARLMLDKSPHLIQVPLTVEQTRPLSNGREPSMQGWSSVPFNDVTELAAMRELLLASYRHASSV